MNKKSYTIWLPSELKCQLENEAKEKGLTLSAYIITLLNGRKMGEIKNGE